MSTFFWDAFERILKTFVQAFLAQTTAAGLGIATIADTSMLERGLVAGLAAVLSLLTSWLSRWASSDTKSASAIPAKTGALA